MQRYAYFANVVCLFVANFSLFASFTRFAHNELPKVYLPEGCIGLDGLCGETLVAITINSCYRIVKLSSIMFDGDTIAALTGTDEVAVVVDVDGVVRRGIYII